MDYDFSDVAEPVGDTFDFSDVAMPADRAALAPVMDRPTPAPTESVFDVPTPVTVRPLPLHPSTGAAPGEMPTILDPQNNPVDPYDRIKPDPPLLEQVGSAIGAAGQRVTRMEVMGSEAMIRGLMTPYTELYGIQPDQAVIAELRSLRDASAQVEQQDLKNVPNPVLRTGATMGPTLAGVIGAGMAGGPPGAIAAAGGMTKLDVQDAVDRRMRQQGATPEQAMQVAGPVSTGAGIIAGATAYPGGGGTTLAKGIIGDAAMGVGQSLGTQAVESGVLGTDVSAGDVAESGATAAVMSFAMRALTGLFAKARVRIPAKVQERLYKAAEESTTPGEAAAVLKAAEDATGSKVEEVAPAPAVAEPVPAPAPVEGLAEVATPADGGSPAASGSAQVGRSAEPPQGEPSPSVTPDPSKGKKPKLNKTPFTRAAVERKLLGYHEATYGAQGAADSARLEEMGGDASSFVFYQRLPGEVRNYIEGHPAARRLFKVTDDVSKAKGEDAMQGLGDEYWAIVDRAATGRMKAAKESARTSPDPAMHFWAAVHDNLPPAKERPAQIGIDPATLNTGQEFELNGHKFQVVEDADGLRLLKDGDDYPETPVDALAGEKIPVDKGTLKEASDETLPAVPDDDPFAGFGDVATPAPPEPNRGVFGQPVYDPISGETRPMFHEPVDVPGPTSEQVGSDNANDPANTGKLFEGGGGMDSPIRSLDAKSLPPTSARIDPDPLPGGNTKKLSEMIFDVGKGVGKFVRTGAPNRGAAGTYYPGSAKTVVRFAGDLDTTAHEVAHALDDRFGVVGRWAGARQRSPFDAELMPNFSGYGSVTKTGPHSSLAYQRAEGVAEWMRAWMVNPTAAESAAPQFAAHFKASVPEAVRATLREFGDDIRRWAGSTPVQKTLANVNVAPAKDSLLGKVSRYFAGDGASFQTTGAQMTAAKWTDSLLPIANAIRRAKELRTDLTDISPVRDPEILMRLLSGSSGKLEEIHAGGMIKAHSADPTKPFERAPGVGGGDAWLLGEGVVDTSSMEAINRDHTDAIAFMISERAVEKAARIQQDALDQIAKLDPVQQAKRGPSILRAAAVRIQRSLTGVGGGIESDLGVAKNALAEIASDPARLAKARKMADRYRTWADANLQYWVDKGRLSREDYARIKTENQYYTAMNRLMGTVSEDLRPTSGGKKLGGVSDVLKRFKGGSQMIDNPFVNLLAQTDAMVREADRNEFWQRFTDLLRVDRKMYQGAVRDLDAIGSRAKSTDPDTIKVFRGGNVEHWQFDPGVMYAAKDWAQIKGAKNMVDALFRVPGRVARWGIVRSPGYMVRNLVKDTVTRPIISDSGGQVLDIFKPGVHTRENAQALAVAGGDQGALYLGTQEAYHGRLARALKDMVDDGRFVTVLKAPRTLMKAWEWLGHHNEMANRLPEFKRAYDQALADGRTAEEAAAVAAYRARDLMDFARGGVYTKWIDNYVPFTNAGAQGVLRMGRAFASHPVRSAAQFAALVLLPRLAIRLMQGKDTEEYKNLPDYQRDMFLNFKVGPNKWASVPQPYDLGVLGAGVERLIDYAMGDKKALDGWAGDLWRTAIPLDPDQLAGPIRVVLEETANYDFFRNQHIIPPNEEGLDLRLRPGTDRASRIGQWMQQAFGADGRQVDHFIRSQLGGIGDLALKASNVGRDDRLGAPDLRAATGLMRQSPVYEAKVVRDTLDLAERLDMNNVAGVRYLSALLRRASTAKTEEQRDELATKAREYAAKLQAMLKKHEERILQAKERRVAAKKKAAAR